MELTAEEKAQIDKQIENVDPAKEQEVREQFKDKYGRVGAALLGSKYKVVRDLGSNVVSLYEMLVDPDFTVPWQTKAKIIVALGYFISPVDAIPDAVPVFGFVDDALVVAYVVHTLRQDIVDYREFRKKAGRPLP